MGAIVIPLSYLHWQSVAWIESKSTSVCSRRLIVCIRDGVPVVRRGLNDLIGGVNQSANQSLSGEIWPMSW